MILRAMILAAGLAGALSTAQFPAFSQQYLQRLGGAVDALDQVVADFDTSGSALGLSREQALAQMQGSAFVNARRKDMQRSFLRHAALSEDLAVLQDLNPFRRAYHLTRFSDAALLRGTWSDFQPALPLTLSSVIFAAFGFIAGALGMAGLAQIRRKRRRPPMPA